MIVDVMEAIDVLAGAIAAWIAVGVAAVTPVVLTAAWGLCALWRWARDGMGSRKALEAPLAPSQPSSVSESTTPAKRLSEPHTPAWTRKETA